MTIADAYADSTASSEGYPAGWDAPADAGTCFPTLRGALDPVYADATDEEIEAYVAATLPGVAAAELEQAAEDLLRALGRAAPGALSGALTGLQVGSAAMPGWGSVIGAGLGALGGGLLSLLSPTGQAGGAPLPPGPQATRGAPPSTVPRPAPTPPSRPVPPRRATPPPPRPVTGPPLQGSAASAAQLLALLGQPQVVHALMALALGAAGRREVAIEGATVQVSDVAAALGRLGEAAGAGPEVPR